LGTTCFAMQNDHLIKIKTQQMLYSSPWCLGCGWLG
jgi:hypothetical protein